ncbi:MAG: type I restriction enzyme HsdR N-terminal domain-containing protein [Bacteroidales bacterium]
MWQLNLPSYSFKITTKEQKKYIFDDIRKKFIALTPEEWVRQNFIKYLIREKKYPPNLLHIEMAFELERFRYRADIVSYNRDFVPSLIVECKAPDVKITQKQFDQIALYNLRLKVPFLVVTNGIEHYCCRVDFNKGSYSFIKHIPGYDELNSLK